MVGFLSWPWASHPPWAMVCCPLKSARCVLCVAAYFALGSASSHQLSSREEAGSCAVKRWSGSEPWRRSGEEPRSCCCPRPQDTGAVAGSGFCCRIKSPRQIVEALPAHSAEAHHPLVPPGCQTLMCSTNCSLTSTKAGGRSLSSCQLWRACPAQWMPICQFPARDSAMRQRLTPRCLASPHPTTHQVLNDKESTRC